MTASSDKRRLDTSDGAAEARSFIASSDGGRSEMVWRKLTKNAARSRQLSCAAVLDSCCEMVMFLEVWECRGVGKDLNEFENVGEAFGRRDLHVRLQLK